jgi:hypothetical protein
MNKLYSLKLDAGDDKFTRLCDKIYRKREGKSSVKDQ